MKKLGLKNLLILSVVLLVGLSVSISSYILYQQEKQVLTENIIKENTEFVNAQSTLIESFINDKFNAVDQLADRFKNTNLQDQYDDAGIVGLTKTFSSAMNVDSVVLAFETGDAYWNMSNESWPDNKYDKDINHVAWFKTGRKASKVTLTNPYLGTDGDVYWVTITENIKNGVITADMTLDFLSEIAKQSAKIPGSNVIILNHDTTILASSSPTFELGKKASANKVFKPIAETAVSQDRAMQRFENKGNNDKRLSFSRKISVGDKEWYFIINVDEDIAFATLYESANVAIMTAVIAVVISMILAFFIIQILYRPILALKSTIVGLSSGDADLTQRLDVKTDDDLGQIALGVNQFIENVQHIMLEIQDATSTLQSRVGRMHEQSERNSNILQSHVAETEQVVTAIEEMNSTADAMAIDAANTADLTQQAHKAGNESRRIVEQSQSTVSDLIVDVDSAVENVSDMSNETQSINNILEVIGGIAEQTNLLALNAAIEAARAGEQGRGFAVVADEVRNLASRTKDSTEEVEAALESLLKGTQGVVTSMDHTKERCQETADRSGEVADSLDSMSSFVDDINGLSTQIATAAEEQSSVTQELTRNMTEINNIVRELETSGNQALQDAEDIANVNSQLSAIVGRFRL